MSEISGNERSNTCANREAVIWPVLQCDDSSILPGPFSVKISENRFGSGVTACKDLDTILLTAREDILEHNAVEVMRHIDYHTGASYREFGDREWNGQIEPTDWADDEEDWDEEDS